MRLEARKRLKAGFPATLLLVAGATVFASSLAAVRAVFSIQDRFVSESARSVISAQRMHALAAEKVASHRAYLLTGREEFATASSEVRVRFQIAFAELYEKEDSPEARALMSRLELVEREHQGALEAARAARAGANTWSPLLASRFVESLHPRTLVLEESLTALTRFLEARFERASLKAREDATRALRRIALLDGAAALLLIAGMRLLRKVSIHRQLRLQAEQKLRAAVDSRFTALSQMAGGLSHEINTPLGTVQLWAEELRELSASGKLEDETVRKATQSIEATVKRIAGVLRSLREFARDAEGDPMAPGEVRTLVTDSVQFFRERFATKKIDLRVTEAAEGLRVHCRKVQIEQVLVNLLNNAYDAVYSLPEKWVRVDCRDAGDQVEISVTDSGRGIPEEFQERIFLPFFTTKGIGKGMGLGLSVSRSVVEQHGGTLALDASSRNTRFVITLPKLMAEPGHLVELPKAA